MTFNRAAALILEQEDREQVIGSALSQVLSTLNLNLSDEIGKVRETREAQVLDTEFDAPRRGSVILNAKLSPLRTGDQLNHGVALVLDDLTAQRDRDQMLATTKRYLPPQMVDKIHEIAKLDLGGERREVTCLFFDTRPIAAFPPGLRPQQIMEMVNVNLATATDCLHATNAVIDKYMGTIIMALFNSQLNPMDNHAAQAIEAGLMLREAFAALYRQLGLDPDPAYYRGGIHTGVATLGNVGSVNRRDFTAIGDTINLAKRLEENSANGQIIISDTALAHFEAHAPSDVAASVRLEAREPVKAKGRQQPTPVYEIFRQ
jgi:class 3 adenylate cyclase